jgi:GNAT superfamily N-acetyltransferase
VGIVAGISDTDQPEDRHLAAMWVAADQRGTSVAEELVEAIVGWATLQGAARVTLWVADANARARRFYDRLGFATTGQRQPLPSAPETGEELLQRPLDM